MTNLRPWQPGVSGNAGGRPKRRQVTELLAAELAKPYGKSGRRRDEALVARLVDVALRGRRAESLRAMQLIFSYVDGLPVARVEAGVPGDFDHGFEIRLIHVEEPGPIQS